MSPPSQKSRPISVFGAAGACTLALRPEDLQWTEPSRISVNNTLGDAWIDAFGPGVGKIVISGTTGWGSKLGFAGEAAFMLLYHASYKGWHDAVAGSKAPESVPMFFVDALDIRMAQVVPDTFTMKRNKSRPLLIQYNISYTIVKAM